MTLRIPGAIMVPGESSGKSTGGGAKILHHTTEGGSATGAIGAYRATRSWPTLTSEWTGSRLRNFQHMGLEQMARALEHPAGSLPTNTANVVQIEHVGFTDRAAWQRAGSPPGLLVANWPQERWHAVATLCRDIEGLTGCPARSTVPDDWWPRPAGRRQSQTDFVKSAGHSAHVFAPGNHHTDGTGFQIALVLHGGDSSLRILKRGMAGPDVAALQAAVRLRASRCGRPDRMPSTDGIYGAETERDAAFVAYILGLGDSQAQLVAGGLSTYVQERIRDPKLRNRTQIKRAAARRAKHCKGA